MAIFDSEKRPRGLRVPSLTAMKNSSAAAKSQFSFHSKKSNDSHEDCTAPASGLAAAPAPAPKSAPPRDKQLPPPPMEKRPQPGPAPPRSSSMVPPRREVARNHRPGETSPVMGTPTTGLRQASQVSPAVAATPQSPPQSQSPQVRAYAPSPQSPPASHEGLVYQLSQAAPTPPNPQSPPTRHAASQEFQAPAAVMSAPQASESAPHPQASSAARTHTISPPPQAETDALTPLEDFIPTPDGAGTPLEPVSSDEQAPPDTYTPPELEPVAAPLGKVHFACFQEHSNMVVVQNVWCPVPCMTCNKFDREIRHRCVFCCLRVCESCNLVLQKCQRRSLAELLGQLG
ncbi:uncharacterized protein N7482_005339 [Penicillium canariense]|uniref:Uncharacterized protein n=1 Tax=Penicillium canariense TaxID=189055 RepID=A0A9W9I4J3_9EURO|nr:uncharacterized protein N7482_005339 [Penicillium canariense]KAJ5166558.1 hypothetical protein N7482_005339 [Penicillium canariense]